MRFCSANLCLGLGLSLLQFSDSAPATGIATKARPVLGAVGVICSWGDSAAFQDLVRV